MTSQRIDRLLRSLVGVADVRMLWNEQTLRTIYILRDARTTPHQLIRNTVSGLHAAFGIQVLPTQVHVHDDPALFAALTIAADVLTPDAAMPAAPAASRPAPNGGAANGNGTAKPAATGGDAQQVQRAQLAAPAARLPVRRDVHDDAPVRVKASPVSAEVLATATAIVRARHEEDAVTGLKLERIDLDRRGVMVRCRTVLALGGRIYSAIAEAPDSATAEAELAARVAVDALRAGGLTTALLEGVGFITIGRTNYCVATVRESGSSTPRAGTAPMIDSMAASATAAVLTALGSFTDARAKGARAGH